jgi:hypothetical protein
MLRFKNNYKKFIKHLKQGSLLYALRHRIKNLAFSIKERRNRWKLSNHLLMVSENPIDILLIQSPPWDSTQPPLGVAYLSSYLKKQGFKTHVFDLNILLYHLVPKDLKYLWGQKSYDWWVDDELFAKTWSELRGMTNNLLYEILKKNNVAYIGLSVNFASIKFASEAIKIIKGLRSEVKIIVGGWGCITGHMRSLFPKDLVDVFVIGEGEETLKEVIEAFRGNINKNDVLGAIFNKEIEPIYRPRPPVMDLDSIPWPTFSEFHLEQYATPVVPLYTSRGCIGTCSFCNDWQISKPYRYRSAQDVFEEIGFHVKHNRAKVFSFKDLLCNGNIDRLNLLSDLIIKSGIKIQWDSQAIPRKEMTHELLCKLRNSGCETLIYGVESFSNNVLRKMGKLFTKEVAEKVIRDTHAAGIRVMINIIVGFPGETEDDFRQTYEAIERNQKFILQIGAVSVCLVNNDCSLDLHPQNYGLVLSTDPKIRPKKWVSIDGENRYEIRKERAEGIVALLDRVGLQYTTMTI